MSDAWASARPFLSRATPAYVVNAEDAVRVQSYDFYENIFRMAPGTFKLQQRGQDVSPIYLPGPRKIIESTNRFLAVDWDYVVSPKVGTPQDQLLISSLLAKLFKRETMYAKFATQKRYGLVWGDTIWHVIGNPLKAPGSRLSIKEVRPANYFPIMDPNDIERVIGIHLVDLIRDPRETDPNSTKQLARRQTYRKDDNTGIITTELGLFEIAGWDDRWLKPEQIKQVISLVNVTPLDPRITSFPVYHIKNNRVPGLPFGLSQLQGIEKVLASINQSISDEDLTLVMQGLGMYVSTAGPPQTESGEEGAWEFGPGEVIELPGTDDRFDRVTGVSTVAPMLDHIRFMLDETMSAQGLSDIATGKVDVTVAESGISLALQLAPLLASNGEKEQEMFGIYDQMLYDLVKAWFPVYEQTPDALAVEVVTVAGDPMPKNRAAQIKEVFDLVTSTPPLLTVAEGRSELAKLGYSLPVTATGDASADTIIAEQQALAAARNYDPLMNRFSSELDNGVNPAASGTAVSGGGASVPNPAPAAPVAAPVGP